MMRDGVCDERANIARCLFDGGDCCLENKIKANCDYCPCMLDIDQKNLENQFRELNIKPVKEHESLESFIESWTVEVEHVVSEQVSEQVALYSVSITIKPMSSTLGITTVRGSADADGWNPSLVQKNCWSLTGPWTRTWPCS